MISSALSELGQCSSDAYDGPERLGFRLGRLEVGFGHLDAQHALAVVADEVKRLRRLYGPRNRLTGPTAFTSNDRAHAGLHCTWNRPSGVGGRSLAPRSVEPAGSTATRPRRCRLFTADSPADADPLRTDRSFSRSPPRSGQRLPRECRAYARKGCAVSRRSRQGWFPARPPHGRLRPGRTPRRRAAAAALQPR